MGFNHEPRGGRNGYKAVLKPEEVHVNMIEYGSSHLGIQHYSTLFNHQKPGASKIEIPRQQSIYAPYGDLSSGWVLATRKIPVDKRFGVDTSP